MDHVAVAKALFDAFAAGDEDTIRSLCTADFRARQNNGQSMDLDSVLRFASAVLRVVADFRYEDPVRSATTAGFVEEHRVCGLLPDGSAVNLPVCVVADVRDGKVSNLREYFDARSAAGLASALSPAGRA
jgi:ketosteroid isomerase-like protein